MAPQFTGDRVDQRGPEDHGRSHRFGKQQDGPDEREGEEREARHPMGLVRSDRRDLDPTHVPEDLEEEDRDQREQEDVLLRKDDEEVRREDVVDDRKDPETVEDPPPGSIAQLRIPAQASSEPSSEVTARVEARRHCAARPCPR